MINVMPSSSIRVLGIGEEYRVQDLLSAVDEREALRRRVKDLEADPLILAQESRIAELTRERDEARAELEFLRAHELDVARVSGIVHETDYHCHAGPRDQVIAELQGMRRDSRTLAEQAIQRSAHRRDMVEAAAFVHEYYEHHRRTTEWPDGQRTRDMREEAEAVADEFACTEVER